LSKSLEVLTRTFKCVPFTW